MKILVITLLSLTLTANLTKTYSWDSTAANFLPLQVGNKWVYTHYWYWSGYTKITSEVTGTLVTNGHLYFQLRSQNTPPSSGYSIAYLRVDSSSGNIKYHQTSGGCSWLTNESTGDSLSSNLNDTFYAGCNSSWKLGTDTTTNFFSQSRRLKGFRDNPTPPDWSKYGRSYVYGIGKTLDGFWYQPGVTNWMELKGCVINGVVYGDTTIVGINQTSSEVPNEFTLSQNYPNPFNPTTKIGFRIAEFGLVRIIVYDALGREVQTLVNQELAPGTFEVDFNGAELPSGVYFYKIESGSFKETKRMVLVK